MPKDTSLSATARAIRLHPKQRMELFLSLKDDEQVAVLSRASASVVKDVLGRLKASDAARLLEYVDPDEASRLLRGIKPAKRERIIAAFAEGVRESVQLLSQFDPQTAAGLMSLAYIQVDESEKTRDVVKRFMAHEKHTGKPPAMIVVRSSVPIGLLPGFALGYAKPTEPITSYVRHLVTISHNATREDVVRLFREHPHGVVAVLSERKQVLGVIYSDDILRLLDREASASLYDFAGVHAEESVGDSLTAKVKSRYGWLLVNLATAFLAASVVNLFQETINTYVLLAVYMPIVAGMGGNAGTQTLAVLVRGIALRQIRLKEAWPVIRREVGAGAVNGLITGVVVAIGVLLISHDVAIAGILTVSMIINLCVAGFFGTLIPLILQKLGRDPATSASIFITTATDVLGFLTFLGLASWILP